MNLTADTNLLVRVVLRDDDAQARTALSVLEEAAAVAIPLAALCELVWVLGSVYHLSRDQIALSVRMIVERANVLADTASVAAGLRMLDAGGDFADGVIAVAGAAMGGQTFVSFDRKAVSRLNAINVPARHAGEAA